jgi:hypothetical protein
MALANGFDRNHARNLLRAERVVKVKSLRYLIPRHGLGQP